MPARRRRPPVPEAAVTKAALLVLALGLCSLGMAWLAVAMGTHWQQVRGNDAPPSPFAVRALRVQGAVTLLAALLVCLRADHASMAVLVWVMALTGAALAVAFTLSWRPRWLKIVLRQPLSLVNTTHSQ